MLAVPVDQQHVVAFGLAGFHSRRTLRHAGHGKADGSGPFGEQALDLARRHVSLDGITFHHRGVAATERIWNTVTAAHDAGVFYMYGLHPEAVGAQVVEPRAAAASTGVEVHVD